MFGEVSLNLWAVIVAALVPMVTGMIWYSPQLTGKMWMKWQGLTQADMNKEGMGKMYGLMFLGSLVTAYVLAHFVSYFNVTDINTACTLAFWLWLGFLAAGGAAQYIFPAKPFNLFLFDSAYKLVNLAIMASVLALWT